MAATLEDDVGVAPRQPAERGSLGHRALIVYLIAPFAHTDWMSLSRLPPDTTYVRTTPTFNETSVPAGLLGQHRVADSTWGVLTVHSGSLTFVFDEPGDDGADGEIHHLGEGDQLIIPPRRLHHLELDGAATFDVAFHRQETSDLG